ncbi:MAG: pyruvate kinase [Planctomycetota bacterium]
MPRSCRIVCTIGPSSSSPEVLEGLLRSGMNVARLNFSHGSHDSHRATVSALRGVSESTGIPVALLQDLQGHKVRVGSSEEPICLEEGARILVGHGKEITKERLGLDYRTLRDQVGVGHRLYLDDGLIELVVRDHDGDDLVCEVEVPGDLKSRKGVIFPDSDLRFPLIADKDLEDAKFGAEVGVDFVAMSFVRSATEIFEMRVRLADWGAKECSIVAKVEDRVGIENIDEILAAADAVLIARGDMGVTLPREEVPGVQKRIIHSANARGVPVITATQMLETMTTAKKPTRAEVSDVHNAVADGTDAVMLSGETATGRDPVNVVQEMDRICRAAEELADEAGQDVRGKEGLHDKMAEAAAVLAESLGARAIVSLSLEGSSLRALSSARPSVPVWGVLSDEAVYRRLLLHRGLRLKLLPNLSNEDSKVDPILDLLRDEGHVEPGDRIVALEGRVRPHSRRTLRVCQVAESDGERDLRKETEAARPIAQD